MVLQIQFDFEELEVNMEQDDDNESIKSEVKFGKFQFQLDYDFIKNEVGYILVVLIFFIAMLRRFRIMSVIIYGVKKTLVFLDFV